MARDFSGTTQYMNLGNQPEVDPAHGITGWAWIHPDSVTGSRGIFLHGRSGVSGWGFYTSNDEVAFVKNGVVAIATTTFTLVTGEWQFIAVEENSSGVNFYHYRVSTDTWTTANKSNTSAFITGTETDGVIGSHKSSLGAYSNLFDGRLAQIGVDMSSLAVAEIKSLSRFGIYSSLEAFYPLDGLIDPDDDYSRLNNTATNVSTTKHASNPPVEHIENYI